MNRESENVKLWNQELFAVRLVGREARVAPRDNADCGRGSGAP